MVRRLSIPLAIGMMAGCASAEGLPFERNAPPQILVPAPLAGAVDRRGRFREIFCALSQRQHYPRPCAQSLHTLSGEAGPTGAPVASGPPANPRRIVIIPGIFGECAAHIATPFKDAVQHLKDQRYQVDLIEVSGRSSSAANARVISEWLAARLRPGERLLLIGYSKGTSDIIEMLERHPRSIPAGTAIVSVAGVVAGTPAADRWESAHGAIAQLPLPGCGPGDGAGMASITRRERLAWLPPIRCRGRCIIIRLPLSLSEATSRECSARSTRSFRKSTPGTTDRSSTTTPSSPEAIFWATSTPTIGR